MDPIEVMVNQHQKDQRKAAQNKRVKHHTKRIYIAVVVAVACILFSMIDLVHPGFAVPLMVVSLMWGCYHLGRCVRFGKRSS